MSIQPIYEPTDFADQWLFELFRKRFGIPEEKMRYSFVQNIGADKVGTEFRARSFWNQRIRGKRTIYIIVHYVSLDDRWDMHVMFQMMSVPRKPFPADFIHPSEPVN